MGPTSIIIQPSSPRLVSLHLYPYCIQSHVSPCIFLFMHSLLPGMMQATATTHSVSKKNQVISESAIFHRQASTSNRGRNGRPVYSLSLSSKVDEEISPVRAFYSDSNGEGPVLNTDESHLVCFHECFWLILKIRFKMFMETAVIRLYFPRQHTYNAHFWWVFSFLLYSINSWCTSQLMET